MNDNFILLGITSLLLFFYLFRGVRESIGVKTKFFEKFRKNTVCNNSLVLDTQDDCVKAIKELNLIPNNKKYKWWIGDDATVPPGCSWADHISLVGEPTAFWNKSRIGKPRYDLNPVCYMSPKISYNYMDYLKKINRRLKVSTPDVDKKDVPIALNVNVGNDTEMAQFYKTREILRKRQYHPDMIKTGILGEREGMVTAQGNFLKSRSKKNGDLQKEGFDNHYKLKAINSLLMDLNTLKNEGAPKTPISWRGLGRCD